MAIRPSKLGSVSDTSDPTKVQPSDLNTELLPASPEDGDLYQTRSGTTPNRVKRLYIYDEGDWRLMSERYD